MYGLEIKTAKLPCQSEGVCRSGQHEGSTGCIALRLCMGLEPPLPPAQSLGVSGRSPEGHEDQADMSAALEAVTFLQDTAAEVALW